MIDLLDSLPLWLLGFVVVAVWAALAAGGVVLSRGWIRARLGDSHHDVIGPLFTTAATMYAIVLAFLTVVVWQQWSDADASNREEATLLVTLYRETLSMPEPLASRLRGRIRDYTNDVVKQEWPDQRQGHGSRAVQADLDSLYHDFLTRPQEQTDRVEVGQEFLANLNRLSELRANRILSSRSTLPVVLIAGLLIGGILTIGFSAFFLMEKHLLQILANTMVGSMIGLLLFMVLALAQPYSGPMALDSGDFSYALTVFAGLDKSILPDSKSEATSSATAVSLGTVPPLTPTAPTTTPPERIGTPPPKRMTLPRLLASMP